MHQNGRPYHLPQMKIPYQDVLQKLDEEGIDYNLVEIKPSDDDNIKMAQKFVFSNEVHNVKIDDNNPIYLSDDGTDVNICDGHHRYFSALYENKPIKAVKVNLNEKDACRVLNKIQDIYEYEQSHNLEEVEMQDTINYYQGDENQFLNDLEEDNLNVQAEKPSANQQSVVAYRKDPIKENSVVGNFFTLEPVEGYDKYQIDFDNLLDTHVLGIEYKDGQQPIDILAKIWFPHVNFEEISKKYNMQPINLKNKAIAEKAMHLGYDGIKFGDKLIQGLK
jgi:hypothetical protein